jgi:hypothetical protein
MQMNRHRGLRSVGHHAVAAIAKVLNFSQDYMKHTKVCIHTADQKNAFHTNLFSVHRMNAALLAYVM